MKVNVKVFGVQGLIDAMGGNGEGTYSRRMRRTVLATPFPPVDVACGRKESSNAPER